MSNYSDSTFDESNQNTSWYKVYSRIPKKSVVLDVGCSSGNFGEVLTRNKKCVVDGVELFPEDARLAAKKLRTVAVLNIETDDLSKIPKNSYDFIYFGDVIEHLVDPVATLERVKPCLKKTGAVIFSIPNMGYLGVRLALLEGDFEYTKTGLLDNTHLHYYTQKEVMRVFREAGYTIDDIDFVQKDYPRKLLQSHLNKIGLTPHDAFYGRMAQTDASSFQFVGVARPSTKTNKVARNTFGPIDLFEKFYEDTLTNHNYEVRRLKKELQTKTVALEFKSKHPYRSLVGYYKKRFIKS